MPFFFIFHILKSVTSTSSRNLEIPFGWLCCGLWLCRHSANREGTEGHRAGNNVVEIELWRRATAVFARRQCIASQKIHLTAVRAPSFEQESRAISTPWDGNGRGLGRMRSRWSRTLTGRTAEATIRIGATAAVR